MINKPYKSLLEKDSSKYKDKISGGMADKRKPSDFDPSQLAKGLKHEMEHTDDPSIAKEIAMDHLTEDPNYYIKLEKIEKIEEVRLVIKEMICEYWSQHLDNVMDPGDDLPWDNNEDGLTDDEDPRNPANVYKDANNSLGKVKASAHPRNTGQKAGVKRGSGPPGGGRIPGGKRV